MPSACPLPLLPSLCAILQPGCQPIQTPPTGLVSVGFAQLEALESSWKTEEGGARYLSLAPVAVVGLQDPSLKPRLCGCGSPGFQEPLPLPAWPSSLAWLGDGSPPSPGS